MLRGLSRAGLQHWCEPLEPLLRRRLSSESHGDFERWQAAVNGLPAIPAARIALDEAVVSADGASLDDEQRQEIRDRLMQLTPWRKGPFHLHGIDIDAEWRSDLKWQRFADDIAPLQGRRVLDVGCGNGYYAFRTIGAGAALVIGIEPTLLYVLQFAAINHFVGRPDILVLPLRLSELPQAPLDFDTTFSMGVLYHQRDPAGHLGQLRSTLRSGGELVLETLIYPGNDSRVREPEDRYARMRNVWALPTRRALQAWLEAADFADIRVLDVSATTTDEQRSTDWMPFESLAAALDPQDPGRTVEGLPAPQRAVLTCRAP